MAAAKKTSQAHMSLKEWIDSEGIATVAKALRVNESAVRHWRRGYVLPKAEQMLKIKKLSRGCVSFEAMIEKHFSPENKKNRFRS